MIYNTRKVCYFYFIAKLLLLFFANWFLSIYKIHKYAHRHNDFSLSLSLMCRLYISLFSQWCDWFELVTHIICSMLQHVIFINKSIAVQIMIRPFKNEEENDLVEKFHGKWLNCLWNSFDLMMHTMKLI